LLALATPAGAQQQFPSEAPAGGGAAVTGTACCS